MEKAFWLKKWEENEIGFHHAGFNDLLLAYFDKFNLPKESNIFLPLCGKSIDLIYFAKFGHKVFGLELSEIAVRAFFEENKLSFKTKPEGEFIRYCCNELKIEILQGDFFELKPQMIGPIDLIYDRASMIALPSDMRKAYSKVLINITQAKSQILLICIEYDHHELIGPPFSVRENEVNDLYKDNFEIVVLMREEKDFGNARFTQAGVKNQARVVYKLIRK